MRSAGRQAGLIVLAGLRQAAQNSDFALEFLSFGGTGFQFDLPPVKASSG
jgi:hypothetical protein